MLLWTTALAGAAVVALLLVGQLVRLQPAGVGLDLALVGPAVVALLEPALPLVGLFAAGLTYGRLRRDGALVALAALGVGPGRRLLPALGLGLALGLTALACAQVWGPAAVGRLRTGLVDHLEAHGLTGGALSLPGGRLEATEAALWATWGGADGTTLLHGQRPRLRVRPGEPVVLDTGPTWVWGPGVRIQVGEARVTLPPDALHRRLGALGAPHDRPSAELDPRDPKQAFLWWRRVTLPLLAPGWAVLGALLGGGLGGRWALVVGAGVVAAAAALLRLGELTARAGFLPTAWAAWAPVAFVALVTLWVAERRRFG